MPGEIHDDHPFVDPESERDPVRRFRGRLSSPVTIVTSGSERGRVGLTVSSLVVAGDERPMMYVVVGPDSRLWATLGTSGRFVAHVVESQHRALSDRFAGVRPSPGGPFAGLEVEETPYGPVLCDLPTRAECTLVDGAEHDDHVLVAGRIDSVTIGEAIDPLQWFRGSYRTLRPR